MARSSHMKLANHHLAMQAHHSALADAHDAAGQPDLAKLHNGLAFHHLGAAEANVALSEGSAADTPLAARAGAPEGSPAEEMADKPAPAPAKPAPKAGAVDALAVGAATQLHRKGHIDTKTRDRIHKSARAPSRPFGRLGGAGHYMGDVDAANSAGTNGGAP